MRFVKAHGLGNDFILVWEDEAPKGINWPEAARRLCGRHTGIGADGLLLLSPSREADFFMSVYNSDGSRAEMCGNGVRCAALIAHLDGRVKGGTLQVDTLAGLQKIAIEPEGDSARVTVNMGHPRWDRALLGMTEADTDLLRVPLQAGENRVTAGCVFMGVPHAVILSQNPEEDMRMMGESIEKNAAFQNGINADFISPLPDGSLVIRTWERGAGPTLACGTGACAAAVVYNHLTGETGLRIVRPLLGELRIDPREEGVMMNGPAQLICRGETFLADGALKEA